MKPEDRYILWVLASAGLAFLRMKAYRGSNALVNLIGRLDLFEQTIHKRMVVAEADSYLEYTEQKDQFKRASEKV